MPHNLVFLFQMEYWFLWKRVRKIEYLWHYATEFLRFFSPCVWKNCELLKKNYRDYLNFIDQGHNKGNVPQFCLHLGYHWTNFNQISTTMMASWPATKKSFVENIGQARYLQYRCMSTITRTIFTKFSKKRW